MSRALWAIAGFCLLAPVLFGRRSDQNRGRLRWGLLGWYLATGLILAGAYPLAVFLATMGAPTLGTFLLTAATYHLDIFGAILLGASFALATGVQPASGQ